MILVKYRRSVSGGLVDKKRCRFSGGPATKDQ